MNEQAELTEWFKQFPERGSTWQSTNQLGDAYITIAYGCTDKIDLAQVINMFKKDIKQEVDITGILSVRKPPEIIEYYGCPAVIARVVSYRGTLADEQVTAEEWHKRDCG